jgi:hypothetical protein
MGSAVVSGTVVSKTVVGGTVAGAVVGAPVVSVGTVVSTGTAAQPTSSSAINMNISFFNTPSPLRFSSILRCSANWNW